MNLAADNIISPNLIKTAKVLQKKLCTAILQFLLVLISYTTYAEILHSTYNFITVNLICARTTSLNGWAQLYSYVTSLEEPNTKINASGNIGPLLQCGYECLIQLDSPRGVESPESNL